MESSSPWLPEPDLSPGGPSGDLSQASPSPPHTSPPLQVPDPPHHQVALAGPAGPTSTGPLAHSQILWPEDAHHSPLPGHASQGTGLSKGGWQALSTETPPEGGRQRPEPVAGSPVGSLPWSSGPLGPHPSAVCALPALRVLAARWEKPIPS